MSSKAFHELFGAYIRKILSQTQLENLLNYHSNLLRFEILHFGKSTHMSIQARRQIFGAYIRKILSHSQLVNLKNYHCKLLKLEARLVEKPSHSPKQNNKVKKRITPIPLVSIFLPFIFFKYIKNINNCSIFRELHQKLHMLIL